MVGLVGNSCRSSFKLPITAIGSESKLERFANLSKSIECKISLNTVQKFSSYFMGTDGQPGGRNNLIGAVQVCGLTENGRELTFS
jgi:hypothetical protein